MVHDLIRRFDAHFFSTALLLLQARVARRPSSLAEAIAIGQDEAANTDRHGWTPLSPPRRGWMHQRPV